MITLLLWDAEEEHAQLNGQLVMFVGSLKSIPSYGLLPGSGDDNSAMIVAEEERGRLDTCLVLFMEWLSYISMQLSAISLKDW